MEEPRVSKLFVLLVGGLMLWGASKAWDWVDALFSDEPEVASMGPELGANQQTAVTPVKLNSADSVFVCRAAIASMMGHEIDIVQGHLNDDGVVQTSYRRPSDNTEWQNACVPDGERIVWASIENGKRGRWRTDPLDETVTFSVSGNLLTIKQEFGDGSSNSDTYERE